MTDADATIRESLIDEAVQIIRDVRRVSTSCLQRRMRIGYTLASRIIDELEARGMVGGYTDGALREILFDLDEPNVGSDASASSPIASTGLVGPERGD